MSRHITVSLRPLVDAADSGLSEAGTPESRLALVETLTREAWSLAGLLMAPYARATTPVSVRPLRPPVPQRIHERQNDK